MSLRAFAWARARASGDILARSVLKFFATGFLQFTQMLVEQVIGKRDAPVVPTGIASLVASDQQVLPRASGRKRTAPAIAADQLSRATRSCWNAGTAQLRLRSFVDAAA